jgi:hypothetical protein
MQLKKMVLVGVSLITIFSAGVAVGAKGQLRDALDHLEAAKRELVNGPTKTGGHKGQAIDHVDKAIHEVKAAIKYRNQ